MPKPNPGGGPVHTERKTATQYNHDGTSRAKYANEPDEEGWEHEGEEYKGQLARQCAAEDFFNRYCSVCDTKYHFTKKECPECGSTEFYLKRCSFCCEPDKMTCKSHGANKVLTKENKDKAIRGSLKAGTGFSEIMLCPCTLHKDDCPFAGQLIDVERYGSSVPRCLPEQELFDSIIVKFQEEYTLDNTADMMMLNRLAMTYVRLMRGEKIIAKYGEIVERTRTSADGSFEQWFEQSAAAKTVDSLDRRLQSWLKELAVSKAAREGSKLTITKVDLTQVLSVPQSKIADYEEIEVYCEDEC